MRDALARRLVDEACGHESPALHLENPGARDRRGERPVERHPGTRHEVDDLEHDVAVRTARDWIFPGEREQEVRGDLGTGALRQRVCGLDREVERHGERLEGLQAANERARDEPRERVRVRGTWQEDRRFGLQVRVREAEPLPPSGDAALLAYLKRTKRT